MEALESLCESCLQAGASDLFLREGATPFIRLGDQLIGIETEPTHEELFNYLWSVCGAKPEASDHDASFVTRSGLRFRVNLHRQLGVRGAVLRNIKTNIPSMEELGLPVALLQNGFPALRVSFWSLAPPERENLRRWPQVWSGSTKVPLATSSQLKTRSNTSFRKIFAVLRSAKWEPIPPPLPKASVAPSAKVRTLYFLGKFGMPCPPVPLSSG